MTRRSLVLMILSLLAVVMMVTVESASTRSSRQRRTAVISMPKDSALRWTNQIIVPVLAMINQTNTYLLFDFQVYTAMPTAANLNLLYNSLPSLGREKDRRRDFDGEEADDAEEEEEFVEEQRANSERRSVYQYLEGFFSNFGLDGPACMQRAICEMAEAPLSGNGLIGRAVELILTPSLKKMPKTLEPLFGPNRTRQDIHPDLEFIGAPVDDEYAEAYRRGKSGGLCWSHYSACSVNIFKLFLHLVEWWGVGHMVGLQRSVVPAVEENKGLIPPGYTRCAAWGYAAHSIRLLPHDSEKALMVCETPFHQEILTCVCPTAQTVVTGGANSVVTVWELGKRSFAVRQHLYGHTEAVTCLRVCLHY